MKCPKCHSDNPDDTLYCGKCATPLPSSKEIPVTETLEAPKEELTTGSTFAGRYQIIEELGKGGMGKVYKALDTDLKEKVAIKLIKPEVAVDKKTIERFRNELKFARKIRHKNVCQMYDLNREEGTHYITMEYVHGEDLKRLIRKMGQMSAGQVISIAMQVCEGMAEAHRLGVVHRDLKPQNIMIDEEGNSRIMDFGIARSVKGKGITGAGVMIGTPEYMSPEQVEGKESDQRSDIYSLGVILYEMVTGRVPFEGDTPFTIGVKHKSEAPRNPKELNSQIPDDLSQVILRCMGKDKEQRYQSAGEVRSELDKIEKGIPTTDRIVPERKPITSKEITVKFTLKKIFVPVVILFVLAAVALIVIMSRGPQFEANRIIVSVFENQTGDSSLDPLGRVASDWITQGLMKTGLVTVASIPPSETTPGSPEEADRIRALAREAGVSKVVSGAYYLQGKTISFHAKVSDVHKGKLIRAIDPVSGSTAEPLKAIELLQQKVMGALAMIIDPKLKTFMDESGQPPTYEAYKEYVEGIDLFFRSEFRKAIGHFLNAAELDPNFKALPLGYAAIAHMNLGEIAKADELVKEGEKASETLDSHSRLGLDWIKAWLQGDLTGRLRAIRQMAQKSGGSYYYQWGLDALDNNRPREAIKALSKLDPEGMWMKGWSWYWEKLTLAYHVLGKHKQELKEARRARKQYPEVLAVLYFEVRALAALGRIDEINKLIDESFTMPPQMRVNPGFVMIYGGHKLKRNGFKDKSHQVLDRALQWLENRPKEEKETKSHREELAYALYLSERWEEARTIYEDLLKEEPENINYIGYLGAMAARRGDREEALRISTQLEEVKRPYLYGNHTYWRACIAALLGKKENAMRLLREAIAQGQTYWRIITDIDLEPLLDYKPFKELIKPKG